MTTWSTERCSDHPTADIVKCCSDCVDVFCDECGGPPNVMVTFTDIDEDGKYPLEVKPK